jgi:pyruvate,water dikinase
MRDDGRGGEGAAKPGGEEGALVLPLGALDRRAIAVCGGKAANLGELIAAGFPVPGGFCVTTAAYARATEGAHLAGLLAEIAATKAGDVAALERLAGAVREAIVAAPIPDDIRDAIARAYREMGEGAIVAVRSSATAEDLPDASFAGQQDTYLHITNEAAVLDAVRRCWASLWTDRAVAYRAKNGIDPRAVRLAVVVQRLVRAAVAGVLFTADPVTGKRRRAVIDASPGLGEAVVSGAVNPDHFEVDTDAGRIEARRLGDKRVVIEAAPGGGTRRVERPAASDAACLSDEEILALARLGAKVEAYYGSPQDTEWALDEARALWLLQARPITTLFPLPPRGDADGERVYLNFNVAQGVFQPFTPMGLAVWRLVGAGLSARAGFPYDDPESGVSIMTNAAGRVLMDLTGFVRSDVGRRALSFAFQRMEARSAAMLESLFEDPRFSVIPSSKLGLARTLGRVFAKTRMPLTLARYLASPNEVPAVCRRAADQALALGDVAASATPEQRLEAARRLLHEGPGIVFPALVPAFVGGMLSWQLAKEVLAGIATPEEMQTTFRALRHNPTTEMDLALWGLAVRARGDAASLAALRETAPKDLAAAHHRRELPRVLQEGLDEFLAAYGARGVAEIDIGVARWRDDPTHILGALANYVTHAETAAAPDAQFDKVERAAEAMARELIERASGRDPARGRLAAFAFSRMRALAGLREAPKFYFIRVLGRARQLLLDVGAALAQAGRLASADDVFMLDFKEVRAALAGEDMRAVAAERRADLAREAGRKNLPRLLVSDGTEPRTRAAHGPRADGSLTGTPASTGRVTAKARVILDPNGARLEHGEILVAPSTDPGWTPLFLTAGGLVMEMGGAMSHGAVVAREYGIPAVVGVPGATDRITTGQTLTVDGGAGTITFERAAS